MSKLQAQMDAELDRARLMLHRLAEVDGHAPRVVSILFVDGEPVGHGLHRGEVGETDDGTMARALGRLGADWSRGACPARDAALDASSSSCSCLAFRGDGLCARCS